MQISKVFFMIASFLLLCFFSCNSYAEVYENGYYNLDTDNYDPSEHYADYTVDNYDNSYQPDEQEFYHRPKHVYGFTPYASRLSATISPPGEKVIIVNPRKHVWGAYNARGKLIRAGLATAGGKWCPDIGRSCRTSIGTFSISSLGDENCVSTKYPIEEGGGAPMPYCMYFNGSQGIHGSNAVTEGNVSHGCVRVSVSDARWIRYHFAQSGTKVIVKPY